MYRIYRIYIKYKEDVKNIDYVECAEHTEF